MTTKNKPGNGSKAAKGKPAKKSTPAAGRTARKVQKAKAEKQRKPRSDKGTKVSQPVHKSREELKRVEAPLGNGKSIVMPNARVRSAEEMANAVAAGDAIKIGTGTLHGIDAGGSYQKAADSLRKFGEAVQGMKDRGIDFDLEDDDGLGAARGLMWALAISACIVFAGWAAWEAYHLAKLAGWF